MRERQQLRTVSTQLELQLVCGTLLRESGWDVSRNPAIAPSPRGGQLRADILGLHRTTGKRIAVFPRWQATKGTAEEKIPFQMLKLEIARSERPDCVDAGYFILEGAGWTWRDYFLSGELHKHLPASVVSKCLSLESFADLAAAGGL